MVVAWSYTDMGSGNPFSGLIDALTIADLARHRCVPIATETMSVPSTKVTNMERKIWTAAELEKMTPAARSEISRAAEITDLEQFPELVDKARSFILDRIAEEERADAS